MDQPLVSVVVPTFNSESFLEKCLASIKSQSYPDIETIIVDFYSTDRTQEIAKTFGARVVLCRAGRSKARNIGVGLAKGEFILFIDSDMELTLRVIEECVNVVEEGYDAVVIPEVSVGIGFWANCKALEKSCYICDELIEASRFFKRELFEVMKGYDSSLEAGEDWDFNQRIRKAGYRIGRIDALIKHHEGRLSLWKTMKKKYHYGKTLEKYKRKHPNEAKYQLGFIRPAFVKNWRNLARDPIHALGMIFMKTCEFGAAGLGYLTYLKSP